MHGHHLEHIEDPGPAPIPPFLNIGALVVGVIGIVAFLLGAFIGDFETKQRVWAGFLVSYSFFYILALCSAAFLAINYIVGAKWFIAAKRPLESLAAFAYMPGFVFPLVALLGTGYLYYWAMPGASYPYEGTVKAIWLSTPVHVVKVILYTAILSGMTWLLVKKSSATTSSPEKYRAETLKAAIIYMIVFAPVFSLWAVDVLKSLEPKWFSTMWGVYIFAGGIVSCVSCMMLMGFWLRLHTPHLHERQMYDIGTYVMGFSTFMIYIGFSQFMLIWYANIPDEITYYLERYEGGWMTLTLLLPLLKWIIPFFLLMPPPLRTNEIAQGIACCSILGGQLLDIYWIVAPVYPIGGPNEAWLPGPIHILTFLGVGGFFIWAMTSYLASHSLLPTNDPDLLNSVNGEYLHA